MKDPLILKYHYFDKLKIDGSIEALENYLFKNGSIDEISAKLH
jgi:hypothetical protein